MKKTTYKIIFNRKDTLNKEGKGLIQIECYLEGKRKYISTGIKIEPEYWDKKFNRVKNNHENFVNLNRLLYQQIQNLEDFEFKNIETTGNFSLDRISELKQINGNNDFIRFCFDNLAKNTTMKIGTRRHHKTGIERLQRYRKSISFSDINFSFVQSYDNFLQNEKIHVNTIANMHKILKVYINLAIHHGFIPIENYAYNSFKVKKEKTERAYLTMEEVSRIENIVFPKGLNHLELVRDMFVFSCYTGLRYSDVQQLRNKDIIQINGNTAIKIKQQKTGDYINLPVSLLFNGKPILIIEKYLSDDPEEKIFNTLSNQHANLKLKAISMITGINKNLTFHLSRHTFGTNLAAATSDQFLIRELMGHSDIRTSMIYIHTSQEQIINKLKNTNW